MQINPGQIFRDYQNNIIDKKTAIRMIRAALESKEINDQMLRASLVRVFDLIVEPTDPAYFKLIEKVSLSEEDINVRKEAINLLSNGSMAYKVFNHLLNSVENRELYLIIYGSILQYLDALRRNNNNLHEGFWKSLSEFLNFDLSNKNIHRNELIDRLISYFIIQFFKRENFQKYLKSNEIYDDINREFKKLRKIKYDSFGYTEKMGNITGLGLSKCHLTHVPKIITLLSKLEILFLNRNRIKEIPTNLSQIKKICINNNNLEKQELAFPHFRELQNLEHLELHSAQIKASFFDGISYLKKLDTLILSNNSSVEEVPEEFGFLFNLKIVNLNSCNIRRLPENVGNLQMLEKLDLSNNNLSYLPKSIEELVNLDEFRLISNNLSRYNRKLHNLDEKGVKIYANPQKEGKKVNF